MGIFTYCSARRPCRVCGGRDSDCRYTSDGLYLCHRRHHGDNSDGPGLEYIKETANGLWGVYVEEGASPGADRPKGQQPRAATSTTKKAPTASQMVKLIKETAEPLPSEHRRHLADSLGLPDEALNCLPFAFLPNDTHNRSCYVFPERNGCGQVIGYGMRYPDGTKRAAGRRGLIVPDGWRELAEQTRAVYCPEGASDVLALWSMGLAAVGRPSNCGGVDQLAELLAGLPTSVEVIVLGENDQKANGLWPGRDGALETARGLARRLGRPVLAALPPEGVKDARCWYTGSQSDRSGQAFAAALLCEQVSEGVLPSCEGSDGALCPSPAGRSFGDLAGANLDRLADEIQADRETQAAIGSAGQPFIYPECPHAENVKMYDTWEEDTKLLGFPCDSSFCPVCFPRKKREWKEKVCKILAGDNVDPASLFLVSFPVALWPTVRKRIARHHGDYVRCAAGNGMTFQVVTSCNIPGADPVDLQRAVSALHHGIDMLTPNHGRAISTSEEWRPEEKKKPKRFMRVNGLSGELDRGKIREIAQAFGVVAEERPVGMRSRIQYLFKFHIPADLPRERVELFWESLSLGFVVPERLEVSLGDPGEHFGGEFIIDIPEEQFAQT